jgi:hypothetical protein
LFNLLQEVGRLRKVFEESFFLINPDGVLPVGVFYFIKMAKEIKKNKIKSINHNGNSWHGITICCKSCGVEFEETSNGYYEPMKYEEDRFNRKCNICRNL